MSSFGRVHRHTLLIFGAPWLLAGLEVTQGDASVTVSPRALTTLLSAAGTYAFGALADQAGRKRAFVFALGLHALALFATGLGPDVGSSIIAQITLGASLGGLLSASQCAVVELVPARRHASLTMLLYGALGLGAVLAVVVLWCVPSWRGVELGALDAELTSKRAWALTLSASYALSAAIAQGSALVDVDAAPKQANQPRSYPAHLLMAPQSASTALCAALFIGQAFAQHVLFSPHAQAHLLSRFHSVRPEHVGRYILPVAVFGMLGPLALGRLADRVGVRSCMITCYLTSSTLLLAATLLGAMQRLEATSVALLWAGASFSGSAAVSGSYVTVSELFPIAVRARALATFYALGALTSQLLVPMLFATPVTLRSPNALTVGDGLAAVGMAVAATAAFGLGVSARSSPLEPLAKPLKAATKSDANRQRKDM